jgi:cytochrome c oxidase subunit 4
MLGIFGALIVLTVITVAVSRVDLGPANSFVAIFVATIKASLVATFFMHLRHDKPFNSVIFVSAFVFLGVFLVYTLNDIDTRGAIDRSNGTHIYERSGEIAPGGFTPRGEMGHGGAGGHEAPAAGGHAAAPAAAAPAAPAADHAAPAAGHAAPAH